MPSKSKDVRLEQCRILEKKLDLRLQQLAQKGIDSEKAKRDSLVKKLKSRIKETNTRIAAADKHVQLTRNLAQAKEQKLAELELKKKAPEAEPKQKKQAAAPAKGEAKKKPAAEEKEPKPKKKPTAAAEKEAEKPSAAEGEPAKKPRKKKEESPTE